MTDKIREAFEKWQSEHDPRQYPAERQAFSAGYQAAIASLEQVAFQEYTPDGNSYYLAYSRCEGRAQVPLYRIAAPSPEENAL